MGYLLQMKLSAVGGQVPFHFAGGGPNPTSLKLLDSGQIPVSRTPMMTSLSVVEWLNARGNPTKSHDLVVCNCLVCDSNIETIPLNSAYSSNQDKFSFFYSLIKIYIHIIMFEFCSLT